MIWQWSQVMNCGFFTSSWHEKKTLVFGIEKVSQCKKNFVSTVRWKILCTLGIAEAYCPSISEKVEIKCGWILKNLCWFWRISKKKIIKRKCPGLFSSGVILLRNNATPHRSKTTMANIVVFGWSFFLHPTNSSNLAPSDYHLLPKLKQFLEDKWFPNEEDVKTVMLKWFQTVGNVFIWMEWTNCFRVTKNISIGTAIMWKNKDYGTLSPRIF